jgi:hypothetical protein
MKVLILLQLIGNNDNQAFFTQKDRDKSEEHRLKGNEET